MAGGTGLAGTDGPAEFGRSCGFCGAQASERCIEEPMQRPLIVRNTMSNLTRIAAVGLLGLLFMQPADASDSLDPQALKALFPGNFHAVLHGQDITFDARPDGSLIARSEENTDTGQWTIRQGKLCVMLTSWLGGRTMCARVVQHGDWYSVEHIVFRQY